MGRSGRAATRLLSRAGASVYASDVADGEPLRRLTADLTRPRVDVELGGHDVGKLTRCDLLVLSPGIPPTAPVLQDPGVQNRPLISELELAFRFLEAPIIAVTGTNGKTTTTAWIGAVMEGAGVKVGVGGNIGRALSELTEGSYDWIVAEVSSFQLAHVERFRPAIGVFLNLSPDHLDRYVETGSYYADKARLFDNADERSRWVLNGDDLEVRRLAEDRPGGRRYFRVATALESGEEGAYLTPNGKLAVRGGGTEIELVSRDELRLLGLHNVANALATCLASSYAGISVDSVRDGLRAFEPLPHRLQPVEERSGVLWVNDSKATNVASTRVALQAMERPVVLLLGGRAKGESYATLIPDLGERVRAVVAYGEAASQIEAELGGAVRLIREPGPFEAVVGRAAGLARLGDVVLLAPACASFDMFRDYEERGERFIELVKGVA